VTVFERDPRALGASVRNFGLGLALGQPEGELLDWAHTSRERWLELLGALGVWHKAEGARVVARDAAEWDVLQAFQAAKGKVYGTALVAVPDSLHGLGALASPHEIGMEARIVLPAFARWLQEQQGVEFRWGALVREVQPTKLATSAGLFEADHVIVCSGHDFQTLFADAFAPLGLTRCALQMLRLASPGRRLGPALMTGLSTLHYPSFAGLPEVAALRARVAEREPALLAHGIHLIVQQLGDADELVVGDSHHYGDAVAPFAPAEVEAALLGLTAGLIGAAPPVRERWQGVYASGPRPYERLQPVPGVTAVVVSSGIGMSVSHGLAEATLAAL
jgi:FAD dependent oxidoreductase TIGR03364